MSGPADPSLAETFAPHVVTAQERDSRTEYESGDEYRVGYTIREGFFGVERNVLDRHLDIVNAAHAYARDATGAGQTVLVVDTGIRETHREFNDGRVTGGVAFPDLEEPYVPTDDDKGHGTAVAGILAARRGDVPGGLNMHGVAFDAHVYFVPISLGSGDGVYRPLVLEDVTEGEDMGRAAYYGRFLELAEEGGADIINQSFGIAGVISQYDPNLVRQGFRHTAEVLEQRGTPAAEKKIIVWAAGNDRGNTLVDRTTPAPYDSPSIDSGLPVAFPELRGHVIAVVALDQDGRINETYSNQCGVARDHCIAAPGTDILFPASLGDNAYSGGRGGTSFAAPVVSGALAVMRQHFRDQLGNTELVTRLYASADKSGVYANRDIYGQGVVDLDRATLPLGTLSVATGPEVGEASLPLDGSALRPLGRAAGDALARSLAGREFAAFDGLGAPFFIDAGSWLDDGIPVDVAHPSLPPLGGNREPRRFPVAGGELSLDFSAHDRAGKDRIGQAVYRLAGDGGGELFLSAHGQPGRLFGPYRDDAELSAGFERQPFHSAPHLQFLGDGVGVGGLLPLDGDSSLAFGAFRGSTRLAGWGEAAGEDNLGALLELSTLGDSLSFQAGVLDEAAGVAGISPRGALGEVAGRTFFGGFSAGSELGGGWRARLSAHAGHTNPDIRVRGVVRDVSPVATSSFGMAIEGRGIGVAKDSLGLSLGQPLRIEGGSVRMRLPVGRTPDRKVVHESFEVGLEPSARTLDLRLRYARPLGPASIDMALGVERHAGHSRDNGDDLYGHFSVELPF